LTSRVRISSPAPGSGAPSPTTPDGGRARLFLALSVALTIGLAYVPHGRTIGFPLVLLSTVAHEMGHAIAALLLGGSVNSVEIFLDGSGLASSRYQTGRFANAFVSAGGLVGPACAAALCFVFARRPLLAKITLGALGVMLALSIVFFVRNAFGIVYCALLAAMLLAVGLRVRASIAQLVLIFVAVQLALSVFTRADYLFTGSATVDGVTRPSDVGNMANALFLPYWFWGGICAAFSLAVLVGGLWLFFRAPGGRRAAAPSAVRG
jgi:hypothetical protein